VSHCTTIKSVILSDVGNSVCFSNSHSPSRNYELRVARNAISHSETGNYDFPSPMERSICSAAGRILRLQTIHYKYTNTLRSIRSFTTARAASFQSSITIYTNKPSTVAEQIEYTLFYSKLQQLRQYKTEDA